jgi:hypothetical protein
MALSTVGPKPLALAAGVNPKPDSNPSATAIPDTHVRPFKLMIDLQSSLFAMEAIAG